MIESKDEINTSEENKTNLINNENKIYIYNSPFNCFSFSIIFSLLFLGIILFAVFIILGIDSDIWLFMLFIPIFLIILSIIFSCVLSLYDTIIIDLELGLITTKNNKFLFCFGQKHSFGLIEVEQILIQINQNINYSKNYISYNCFDVIFKLLNGKEIKGIIGLIDKNNESQKIIGLLKKTIPSNIPINGDLVENDQAPLDKDSHQLSDIPIISL